MNLEYARNRIYRYLDTSEEQCEVNHDMVWAEEDIKDVLSLHPSLYRPCLHH